MSEKKFYIKGDHPVLMRPDKYGLDKDECIILRDELIEFGYENIEYGVYVYETRTHIPIRND